MAKIIAIANQKGGVGKTTTSINISASIAIAEHKTLIIDFDPQGNSTSGLGFEPESIQNGIYEVISDIKSWDEIIIPTQVPNLDIAPANINLVGAEIELVNIANREKKLSESFKKLTREYEYIFIDCPPSLGLLTLNALTAANSVLIPVQAEYYALEGLGQLLNTINRVKKYFNSGLELEGVLLTMYDSRLRLSKQVAEEVRKYFRNKVFNTIIYRNVRLSEAPSFGKPVIMHDAVSTGTYNYIDAANEIIDRNKTNVKGEESIQPSTDGNDLTESNEIAQQVIGTPETTDLSEEIKI